MLADRTLHAELEIRLLLSCNVIVYEAADNQSVRLINSRWARLGGFGRAVGSDDV